MQIHRHNYTKARFQRDRLARTGHVARAQVFPKAEALGQHSWGKYQVYPPLPV